MSLRHYIKDIDWAGGFNRSDIGWRAIAREKEAKGKAAPAR